MAKINDIVEYSVDLGIMGNYLPEFQLFIVTARIKIPLFKTYHAGWAIVGANTKKEAKELVYKNGWIKEAKVSEVLTFPQYIAANQNPIKTHNRFYDFYTYEQLENMGKLPTKIGEWIEMKWT
jgi:hypothetical protein